MLASTPNILHICRIGCCLEVILITWLLWKPIDCNRNRLNEGNRTAKSFKQLFSQNYFDPALSALNISTGSRNSTWNHSIPISNISDTSQIPSSLSSENLNYLLSSLKEEERETITAVINEQSETPKTFLFPNHKRDDTEHNNEIELGIQDKRGIREQNKLSLFSSSLNVIDVEPQDTQLAHSVLVIHRPKPNKTVKPTIKPQQQSVTYISNTKPNNTNSKSPIVTAITNSSYSITTSTASYATPVKNNHRPMNNMPFIGLRAKHKPSTTSMAPPIPISTTPITTTTITDTEIFNTTTRTSQLFEEEVPVIFKNNHKKPSTGISEFTRQKLSTEYALIFTTPSSSSSTDKTNFSEDITLTTTPLISSIRPPYVTPFSHPTSSLVSFVKRPPMKIMNINGNKVKPPEEVYSHGITVLDPPFIAGSSMKLPPNTTILHKNLIVPMKEGRPKPIFPIQTTTQFPVYPMLAGITKWHTQTPTTSWSFPIITTNSPENTDHTTEPQTLSTETSGSPETPVTAQSIQRPTIITSDPIVSTAAQHQSVHSHLVTVTPLNGTHDSSQAASNTFIVTHSSQTPRPSTSTTGYVNAIWAPPMPISRPLQNVPQQQVQSSQVSGGWFSPLTNLFTVDSSSGIFSFLTIMRTVLFTVLVMFLPPLTLAAALMNAAG